MTLSEMRRILAERGLQLTKSLGQHFLHDGNQLRRLLQAAELSPSDKVLEIGPGLGPLTELLIQQAGEVLAIEKDRRLFEFLEDRFPVGQASRLSRTEPPIGGATFLSPRCGDKNVAAPMVRPKSEAETPTETTPGPRTGGSPVLHLLHADALDYLQQTPRDWSAWKLVANLPYSVASPILVELAQAPGSPERLVTTLQLEVARRLVAQAGDDDYGVLTLLLQLRYEPRGFFKIPAACFHPPPDVDSAAVTLRRRPHPLLPPPAVANFTRLVKMAFSQRRKMMMKLLKAGWPAAEVEAAFAELGLSPQVRAERVSLEQFVRLTQRLGPPPANR